MALIQEKKKKKALFSQVLFFDIVVAKPDRSLSVFSYINRDYALLRSYFLEQMNLVVNEDPVNSPYIKI